MIDDALDEAPVAAASTRSVDAWHRAWSDAMHFVGDPFAELAEANADDDQFAMGSIFCAAYRVLGGSPFDAPLLEVDLDRARQRARSSRELMHLDAVEALTSGDFSAAAEQWDHISSRSADFAAVRFAHDVYLHIGEVERRVASGEQAMARFAGSPAEFFVTGQHAFSLEEAGVYDEAETLGWRALGADPLDLWALHALAHVYESTDDQDAAMRLLVDRAPTWTTQDGLAVHVHWHHALRMIAGGQYREALGVFDLIVADATTPFRLSDLASLLWRLELEGVAVGDRWHVVADRYAVAPERHTTGFLDLHIALAFSRVPTHPEASVFFAGVATSHADDPSENGTIFREIVVPLVEAIRLSADRPFEAAELIDSVAGRSNRIGGSIAQRDLLTLTRNALSGTSQETP